MGRGRRKASDRANQIIAPQLASFGNRFSAHQLRQRRPAGHRRYASFGLEPDLLDPAILYLQAQTNDVPADWVLDFSARIGIRNVARMAWILKVIEQLRGIHSQIVNGRRSPTSAQDPSPRPKTQDPRPNRFQSVSSPRIMKPWLPFSSKRI